MVKPIGHVKVQLVSNPIIYLCLIPPFCPALQKIFTDSGLLRERFQR